MRISIADLMSNSGVGFGTSGARGLVEDMTELVCYAYTKGFIHYLKASDQIKSANDIALAGDLRQSTPRILNACAKAIIDCDMTVVNTGLIPTPALALWGLSQNCPTLMVTGSHISDDRNGIKFYKLGGEILKTDEQLIKSQLIDIPENLFTPKGTFIEEQNFLPEVVVSAKQDYESRFLNLLPENALAGMRIGVYQHSSVAREILVNILNQLGAQVIPLGFSDNFIPVDTEAVRDEDIRLAKQWSQQYQLDAIVSTDGDADRPLIADERGGCLRGDIVGVLCAHYLNIEHLVTPISSNTCVEKSNWFTQVQRTQIGSPFVIEAMNEMVEAHCKGQCSGVAGYEANGGFLLATSVRKNDTLLSALPTRDAIIVILSVLHYASEQKIALSELINLLPARFTYSDRLKNFDTKLSQQLIHFFTTGSESQNFSSISGYFVELFQASAPLKAINTLDGIRMTLQDNDIIHYRPSGNAPELRCYSESGSEIRAKEINQLALETIIKVAERFKENVN